MYMYKIRCPECNREFSEHLSYNQHLQYLHDYREGVVPLFSTVPNYNFEPITFVEWVESVSRSTHSKRILLGTVVLSRVIGFILHLA